MSALINFSFSNCDMFEIFSNREILFSALNNKILLSVGNYIDTGVLFDDKKHCDLYFDDLDDFNAEPILELKQFSNDVSIAKRFARVKNVVKTIIEKTGCKKCFLIVADWEFNFEYDRDNIVMIKSKLGDVPQKVDKIIENANGYGYNICIEITDIT